MYHRGATLRLPLRVHFPAMKDLPMVPDEPTRHSYPTGHLGLAHETPAAQSHQPAPKRRAGLIAAAIVGVAALVGAGIAVGLSMGHDPVAPAAAEPGAPTGVTGGATSAPAKPAPPAVAKTGQEVALGQGLKATVFGWRAPVAKKEIKPSELSWPEGYVWGSLDVQVCLPTNANSDWTFSSTPWTVRYADNATFEYADVTGVSGWPQPQYPMVDRAVPAGTCIRGWVTYAVPPGVAPTTAIYAPSGAAPVQWSLK